MIVYNITFHIDDQVLEEYLVFLKKEYIPAILKDQTLENPRLCRILADSGDGCSSYSLQFEVDSMQQLNDWWSKSGDLLNHWVSSRFSDKVLGFTTMMETLNHEEE